MLFQVFSEGSIVPEPNILLLANSYALTQEDIDRLIEEVEPEYEGTLRYEPFINLLNRIDPKLMESDKPLSPVVETKQAERLPK